VTSGPPLRRTGLLGTDHHVHSTWSDDAVSTPAENLAAADTAGLVSVRMVDHVRTSTTWVPEFLAEIRALPPVVGLQVLTGVEAKLLDASGSLDVPPDLVVGAGGVDRVLIADHQFPGPDGPWSPRRTREEMARGLSSQDALGILVTATVRAMERVGRGQLAHVFSLLPKIGLSEDDLLDEHLGAVADAARRTGTLVEVNEKWACPGARMLRACCAAGVPLVASTDSHAATAIGSYDWVAEPAPPVPVPG
jgi:putative hydrolase